ncbi:MAG: hypothetical protein M1827_004216 [Pycnora praestabilis]|nr:MAG: hypothetical protein M1827_004216 [Pycnora praestabilis]
MPKHPMLRPVSSTAVAEFEDEVTVSEKSEWEAARAQRLKEKLPDISTPVLASTVASSTDLDLKNQGTAPDKQPNSSGTKLAFNAHSNTSRVLERDLILSNILTPKPAQGQKNTASASRLLHDHEDLILRDRYAGLATEEHQPRVPGPDVVLQAYKVSELSRPQLKLQTKQTLQQTGSNSALDHPEGAPSSRATLPTSNLAPLPRINGQQIRKTFTSGYAQGPPPSKAIRVSSNIKPLPGVSGQPVPSTRRSLQTGSHATTTALNGNVSSAPPALRGYICACHHGRGYQSYPEFARHLVQQLNLNAPYVCIRCSQYFTLYLDFLCHSPLCDLPIVVRFTADAALNQFVIHPFLQWNDNTVEAYNCHPQYLEWSTDSMALVFHGWCMLKLKFNDVGRLFLHIFGEYKSDIALETMLVEQLSRGMYLPLYTYCRDFKNGFAHLPRGQALQAWLIAPERKREQEFSKQAARQRAHMKKLDWKKIPRQPYMPEQIHYRSMQGTAIIKPLALDSVDSIMMGVQNAHTPRGANNIVSAAGRTISSKRMGQDSKPMGSNAAGHEGLQGDETMLPVHGDITKQYAFLESYTEASDHRSKRRASPGFINTSRGVAAPRDKTVHDSKRMKVVNSEDDEAAKCLLSLSSAEVVATVPSIKSGDKVNMVQPYKTGYSDIESSYWPAMIRYICEPCRWEFATSEKLEEHEESQGHQQRVADLQVWFDEKAAERSARQYLANMRSGSI